MSQPYLGEIRMVGFNFAPTGWAFCNGALLSIAQNSALFNLIGTTYGGDGTSTFALPNLQSRLPIHQGNGFALAAMGGTETETLTVNQIPAHTHPPQASSGGGTSNTPAGNYWANWVGSQYSDQGAGAALNAGTTVAAGNNQPHDNLPPYLTVNFIIALNGVFPSQT